MKNLFVTFSLICFTQLASSAEETVLFGDKIDLVKSVEALETSYIIKSKRSEVVILRSLTSNFLGGSTIGCGGPSNAGGPCSGSSTAVSLLDIDDSSFNLVIDSKGREFIEYVGGPALIQGAIVSGRISEIPSTEKFREYGFVRIPKVFNACGHSKSRLPSYFFQLPRRFTDGLINISEITDDQCEVYR